VEVAFCPGASEPGSPPGVRVYYDGARLTGLDDALALPTGSLWNDEPFRVGETSPIFHGKIDEIMVFQRVLNTDELGRISAPDFLASCNQRPCKGDTASPGLRCVLATTRPGPEGESAPMAPVGGAPKVEFALRAITPNPTQQFIRVNFTLPDARPGKIEVFNVSGRLVASREVGSLGIGFHTVTLGERATLASGVYIVRLTQGGKSQIARVVLVR